MNKQEKKIRKLKSIEIMETKKVEEWKKDGVYNDISIYEWASIKSYY